MPEETDPATAMVAVLVSILENDGALHDDRLRAIKLLGQVVDNVTEEQARIALKTIVAIALDASKPTSIRLDAIDWCTSSDARLLEERAAGL